MFARYIIIKCKFNAFSKGHPYYNTDYFFQVFNLIITCSI